jgi:hypothetical protein
LAIEYGSVEGTPRKPMNPPPAEIGVPVAEVETPALIIDLDALDRNIAKMAEFARASGVRVRPHAKTHKSTAIALRQIALGAVGQCVQKVGEVLVRGGVKDVLVSNQVVGERKLRRLAALAKDATIALSTRPPASRGSSASCSVGLSRSKSAWSAAAWRRAKMRRRSHAASRMHQT